MRKLSPAQWRWIDAAGLAALNLFVCWRLFVVEYPDHFSSIEGAFIAIPRYLSKHWGDFSWWPLWHCGMPYADTYVPLLHILTAATSSLAHVSTPNAYHYVTGVMYALGPVALYFLALGFGSPRGSALSSALFYSLFSPCTLFLPAIAKDVGGFWYGRRFQVLVSYGEGPHVSSMTLQLLAILALEYAVSRRTTRTFALASIVLALIFLMNVPGTMATGLAVFCWLATQPAGRRRGAWIIAAGAAVTAYAIDCYGLPPSSLAVVFGNVGSMHAGFSAGLHKAPFLLALALGAALGLGWLLARSPLPHLIRFAVLYASLTSLMVMTARPQTFELLPQIGRMHLEMDIGFCLLLGAACWKLYQLVPAWVHPIVLLLALGPLYAQVVHYRAGVHSDIARADLSRRSEYATARWADTNLPGQRVYAMGSTSFWWNAFTDVPQVIGCCDQGQAMPILERLAAVVNSAGVPAGQAKVWLQAIGADALVVNGPDSSDEYKDIKAPERYQGVLPVLHSELGDTIYAIPQRSTSLAHVIQPADVVPNAPDTPQITRYAIAIEDPARPAADFRWLTSHSARIETQAIDSADLVSVQIASFRGWKASVGGRTVPITTDGLGFQVLHPSCTGPCTIAMEWSGSPDRIPSAVVSLAALALLGYFVVRPRALGLFELH